MALSKSSDDLYVDLKSKLIHRKTYTEGSIDKHQTIASDMAKDVIIAAFRSRKQHRLTAEQIAELEPLVECCVDSLEDCMMDYTIPGFEVYQVPFYLILRSGIQFMIEDFKSLEMKYEDEELGFKQELMNFTEDLESWQKTGSYAWDDAIHSEEELRRPIGIPADHTWWLRPI